MARIFPSISPQSDPALAAPMMIPAAPQPMAAPDPGTPPPADLGQPTLPDAATDQAAPAMPSASPEVQQDASALNGPPSEPRHEAMLHSFDARKTANRAEGATLSVHDPEFMNKLLMNDAQHGQILQDEARYKEQHPWGSMESAHPGVLGKIGHAFGEIGNVAGAALAPGLTAAIPGSHLNLQQQEAQGAGEVKQAGAGLEQSAQTAHANAETGAIPSEIAQREAGTAKTEAETDQIGEQKPETKFEKLQDGSVIGLTTDPHTGNSTAKLLYKGDPQKQTDLATLMVGGKPHSVLVDKATGQTIKDLGETKSPAAPTGNLIVSPEGVVGQAKPGMKLEPGTQNIAGFASQGRPTTQMRNVAGQAQIVTAGIPNTIAEIDRLKDKLGPVAGRWNEFMQGKVGMDDPDFAGLRADLLMTSSAVALMHARGRLPENLREEFDRMINSPKQDPENLKAVLNHILPWAQKAQDLGNGPGPHQPGGEARHKIRIGAKQYTYNGSGDTADLQNYTEVKQ